MKRALILFLMLGAVFSAVAGSRIAVVDLKRVFDEYYKSRIAEEFIKQQTEAAKVYLGLLTKQLESLKSDLRRIGTNAGNLALDPAQKAKAEADAEAAARKVRSKEAEIELYINERKREILKLESRKRAEIIGDIRAEIKRRAAAGGYDFVLDSSGFTTNEQPPVLLFPEKNDISDLVIRELNRTASTPKKTTSTK